MSMQKLTTICYQGAPFLVVWQCRCHAGVRPHRSHVHLYLVGPTARVHKASIRLCRQQCVNTDSLAAQRVGLTAKYYTRINSNIPLVTSALSSVNNP